MEQYKIYKNQSYDILTLKTDKFKSAFLEVNFYKKTSKKEMVYNYLLCDLLLMSCKNYPTNRLLSEHFEDLYDAGVIGSINCYGNTVIISYRINFLDPIYSNEETLGETIKTLFDLILNPNTQNNAFNSQQFKVAKENLKASLQTEKEYPTSVSFKRMVKLLDNDALIACLDEELLELLEEITPEDLYAFYQNEFKKYSATILVAGNLSMENVVPVIRSNFNCHFKKKKFNFYRKVILKGKIKKKIEYEKFEQANLVVGCEFSQLTKRERDIVFSLYNVILGAGSLETKLAKYLRRDKSLCYSVNSVFLKYNSLLTIRAGIKEDNFKIAVKMIKKALKEMEEGKITEQELEEAKSYIISSIKLNDDDIYTLASRYLFNYLEEFPLPEERIKQLKTVKIREIIKLSSKIKLSAIYMLAPKGEKNAENKN